MTVSTPPIPNNIVLVGNAGDQLASTTPEEQVVREITQTDHLNKRLLKSFLERINTTGSMAADQTTDNDNKHNVDEFDE